MIRVLHGPDLDRFSELVEAMFRLRYEHFVVQRKWSLPSFGGRDVDRYDADDAAYILALSEYDESILGYARLNQTLKSSLLADLFPHLIETRESPRGATVFEGTRFALSPEIRCPTRSRVIRSQICVAAAQWALEHGGTHIQTVVDFGAFQTFLEMTLQTTPLGLPCDYGGGPRVQGGGRCIAFRWHLVPSLLDDLYAYSRGREEHCHDTLAPAH